MMNNNNNNAQYAQLPTDWIEQVEALRVQLPTANRAGGAPDPKALAKLVNELIEYLLEPSDYTEIADILYYAGGSVTASLATEDQAKAWIEDVCIAAKITPIQAFRVFEAKYRFRAQKGNPKDKAWERILVAQALG